MASDREPAELVGDADVLMNLLASGCLEEIVTALGLVLIVPPTVSSEALYLESEEDGGARELIDLSPLQAAGRLKIPVLDDPELDLVVELVQSVDDGEAEGIAVALSRQVPMATDDRKARRVGEERGIELVSTLELLRRWQMSAAIPDARLGNILVSIRRRSRYHPGTTHPLYEWWRSSTAAASAEHRA